MKERRKRQSEIRWEEKRLKVGTSVAHGPYALYESDVVRLSIRLAKMARTLLPANAVGFDPTIGQLIGSLGSVAANIMEGSGRVTDSSELTFALYARASAYESLVHSEILEFSLHEEVKLLYQLADKHVESILARSFVEDD